MSPPTTSTAASSSPASSLPILTPQYAIITFLLLTSVKWLLVPTYHSTDFDVHRLWLAITRHLPISEWYYYDANGTTPHTLDYPPLFAFFEYLLSNNFITNSLVTNGGGSASSSSSSSQPWLDEECLALTTTAASSMTMEVSNNCIRFHRSTVIISDVVLFLGAYMAATSVAATSSSSSKSSSWIAFILVVTNPGLIMLDHVHFQYNGMLLGVLLISIACVVRGGASSRASSSSVSPLPMQVVWELLAAATFAALLALKHLYLTLAPLYFVYLLRRHCFVVVSNGVGGGKNEVNDDGSEKDNINNNRSVISGDKNNSGQNEMTTMVVLLFSWRRLLVLGMVTLLCFLGPFVPFMIQDNPAGAVGQIQQILKRLFPFGRGLVHDYWAANVWALYLFISRLVTFAIQKSQIKSILPTSIRDILDSIIPFPEPKPSLVALLLLIGLWPGGIHTAWKIGSRSLIDPFCNGGRLFTQAVVFCSLSSFMLGYHVHEKAILTAIIPMTLLLATNSRRATRLYIRTCTFGLFAIFPLLYRPEELLLKAVIFIAWMCGVIYILENEEERQGHHLGYGKNRAGGGAGSLVGVAGHQNQNEGGRKKRSAALTKVDLISFAILGSVLLFMEIIHPIVLMPSGRMEFLPLMATSVICATGLAWCWLDSYSQMIVVGDVAQRSA